jgi:acyl-CoA thioesterase FadM
MIQESKFSITVKPSYLDRYWGSDFTDYAHLVRYIRDAWVQYARQLGMDWPQDRVLMVIKEENTYMSPLRVEEEATIYARQTKIGRTSGTMEFRITESGSVRPIAILRQTFVWVDRRTWRPSPWPEEWKKAILDFEGKENIEVKRG